MLPKMVNLNGMIYNTAGMVKLNNGVFLIAEKENQLTNLDFTQIPDLISVKQFEVKKPTGVELVFISYIQTVIQDKLNNGEFANLNDLIKAISDINGYVNKHEQLLANMKQLDNKDNVVESQKENLLDYFAEEMNGNKYFQRQVVEQQIIVEQPKNNEIETVIEPFNPQDTIQFSEFEPQQVVVEDVFGQPGGEEINFNFEPQMQNVPSIPQYPEYDEKAVSLTLQKQTEMPDPSFDVTAFINQYFNSFTMSQINLLLSGSFMLSEEQVNMLKQRKGTIQTFNSLHEAEIKQNEQMVQEVTEPAKRRWHVRNNKNNKGQAAFVDTLLLSFTVGTICGVYLMYFVLTIMS